MALQTVTLQLPENIYQRLRRMAETTRRPLEEVVFHSIQGNLPPVTDDLPVEMQNELATLQSLGDDAIWEIAKTPVDSKAWQRHQFLLQKNKNEALSEAEQQELAQLRQNIDHLVLRRSYALALLKWRGHSVSPAED